MKLLLKILGMGLLISLGSCGGYSFTGGDVGDAKTLSVAFFPNNAEIVQPELSQLFTERLRDIFIQQTPLELQERNGDLQFRGSIVGYTIQPINVQASNVGSVAQNELTVTVNVIYTNTLDADKSFEQNFSRAVQFDANVDINQVEDELLDQITQELAENILNQSIGNW